MWLTIILIIVIFVIGKFIYDKNQQSAKITMEGGMRNKYRELIEILISGDSRARIIQETSDSILIVATSTGGSTVFNLVQTFGKLTVQWKVDSPIFGKHKMEWDFQEYGDQFKMAERIANDTGKYQKNIIDTLGFSNSEKV